MPAPIIFELCAETLDTALCARPGGADRIELCTALHTGGLTPTRAEIAEAVERTGVPVHVLIRPHDRGYVYTPQEFQQLCRDVEFCRGAGAAGVVLGVLLADNRVDIARTAELATLAAPMEVTFHRAFDAAPDLDAALEDVIAAGCGRILTSGGQPDVLTGANALARLVQRANGRIAIAAGGGLRMENAQEVRRISGATHFHSSLAARAGDTTPLEARIRAMMQRLREA